VILIVFAIFLSQKNANNTYNHLKDEARLKKTTKNFSKYEIGVYITCISLISLTTWYTANPSGVNHKKYSYKLLKKYRTKIFHTHHIVDESKLFITYFTYHLV